MERALIRVGPEDKSVLRNLLELYEYDFSEYTGSDVDGDGLYKYGYLDEYWTESDRFAYLAHVGGKIAGFVMIDKHYVDGIRRWSVAEFFVLRKYRQKGLGEWMAFQAFDHHRGPWVVMQIAANVPAQTYWRKVVGKYTGGEFEECEGTGDGSAGIMQLFDNSFV